MPVLVGVLVVQLSDISRTCLLIEEQQCGRRTPLETIRNTLSKDSGVDVGDTLARSASDLDVAATNNDDVFARETSADQDGYVGLADAMSCRTTSTTSTVFTPVMSPSGYVVAWTDNDDRSVLPPWPVGEHLLPPRIDVNTESVSQHDADSLASSPSDGSSRRDADVARPSASEYVTTAEILSVLCGEEGSQSAESPMTTRPLIDTAQPHHSDQQSSAVRAQVNAYFAYITLDQLQMSPSNGVPDDRLHSNDSAM